MKFGQQLRQSLIAGYRYHYIAYDDLKAELKNRLYQRSQSADAPKTWTDEDETAFVKRLFDELDKVYDFKQLKSMEIDQRIKDSQKNVERVVKMLNSRQSAEGDVGYSSEEEPTAEDFDLLELELSDIIADVHDLAKFAQLNYTGFQKIIKKHDKQTGYRLKPGFSTMLNKKAFFREDYDAFMVKISKMYDEVRTQGNPIQGDSAAGGSQQNFVRQTTKYWVHPDNITELKLIILKHLPVLVFNPNKEFDEDDSAISSIYYDNCDFELYLGRLQKTEGAEAIRLRWYGGMDSTQIFVERKTHREDWTGEKSVKARFQLKEKNVNAFLRGDMTVEQAFEKMRKEGKKSPKEIEQLEALAREVQYTTITKCLEPVVRSFYHRTAFQQPGDARVRISLDTELTLIREDDWDGVTRSGNDWRRMDIGVNWPFNKVEPKDIERFPYAVLEVKLQTQAGQEIPEWVRELTSSHLVEAVPKFSKFIHGCATLHSDKIDLIPFWLPQMDVDIKKPITHRFGIERPGQSMSLSTTDESEEEDDSEGYGTFNQSNGASPKAISVTNVNDSTTNGGGSTMDVEERVAVRFQDQDNDYPLYDSETDTSDSESYPARHRRYSPLKHLKRVGKHTLVALSYLIPRPRSTVAEGHNPMNGTVFERKFRAPPGKRIFVPVRVEPKVYFAAERTFLSWFEFSIFLSAIAALLLNFGPEPEHHTVWATAGAFGFTAVAVISLMYSMVLYLWRAKAIRERRAIRYYERVGPTVLCVLMVVAVGVNFVASREGW